MTGRTRAWIAAIAGALLLIALALHLAGIPVARDAALVVSAVIAGVPTGIRAWQALRAKAFSIELLVTIAVTGALIIGEFVEAAVVAFLFVFGAWLEARTLERTRRSLRELIDLAPQTAQVRRGEQTVTVPVDDVVAGDTVLVHSGGTIAVDGRIRFGSAHVNEATITGEPLAAERSIGDTVYSGTLVETGYLEIEAEQVGDDTTFAKIIELVEEAQETKTTAQRFLDRFAAIYTPAIIVLSVLVLAVTRDLEFALTFLVIACPGALVISTPVSMVAGLGNGARHGVLVKGGDALERLSKVDTIVLDKTGTLTRGTPEVVAIQALDGDEHRMLRLAAGLELASEHPLGRAIVAAAGSELPAPPDDVEVVVGGGIRGIVEGHRVAVGSRRVLATLGVALPAEVAGCAEAQEHDGSTVVFAVIDGVLSGVISLADQPRPEAAAAISRMRAGGIRRIAMLTGENRRTAEGVAARLGIDEVHAELLPHEKVRAVRELTDAGGRVAMVGDGINDAPAIATADVGIAMGAGTDVSIQTADVILMGNRLDQLVHAIALAKATVRNMLQNTVIAIGTVVALLAGVLLGHVFMSTGMLVHELSVLVVILNAVRLTRFRMRGSQVVQVGRPLGPTDLATSTASGASTARSNGP